MKEVPEYLRGEFRAMLIRARDWLATEDAEAHFNMRVWYEDVNEYPGYERFPDQCGTVMCIGGYITHQPDITPELRDFLQTTTPDLFYPPCRFVDYYKITPAQAITAINNYLTHGDPQWTTGD